MLLLPRMRTCFPFSSSLFIFYCLDPFIRWCFFQRCVWHLQFFLTEEVIDFILLMLAKRSEVAELAALLEVIVTSSLDFLMVIVSSF